jgi:hypothetical protein
VNSATASALRSIKFPVVIVRDLQKYLDPSNDQLLRRWERIAQERRA